MTPVPFNILGIAFSDCLNIVIRIGILFLLGMISTLTLQKRFYQMTLFLFGVWLTFFRLTLLRSILLYVGIFKVEKTTLTVSQNLYNTLQSSAVSNVVSGIVLFSCFLLFFWIKDIYRKDTQL